MAEMDVQVREVRATDGAAWCAMERALFPDTSEADCQEDLRFYVEREDAVAFVAEARDGTLVGMIQIETRSYAEGCGRGPVPYVEGWFVRPEAQRQGIGQALMAEAETWAEAQGFTVLASDCLLNNDVSLAAHTAAGFEEVERAIHFRKRLGEPLSGGV